MQTIIQIHFRAQMKLNYNNVRPANPTQAANNARQKLGKAWKSMEIEC